ncbi:MAG: hypothetical protein HQM08_04410 [Candidatus Riflebacteria bacterium]|nr:hypothetical protein [Candidatus Riflebacteria bacterium]
MDSAYSLEEFDQILDFSHEIIWLHSPISVLFGKRAVAAERVSFVPGNGLHMVEVQLPPWTIPGILPVSLAWGEHRSESGTVRVKAEPSIDRLRALLRHAKCKVKCYLKRIREW